MATLQDILDTVPALLDDANRSVFTGDFILPYINVAQRSILTKLRSAGCQEVRVRSGTITVPAGTTTLTKTTTPALPSDLVWPDELWEAKLGGNNEDYYRIVGPITLPNQARSNTLGYWDWFHDELRFIGANEARDIKLDYWSTNPDFSLPVDPTDTVIFQDAVNVISLLCCKGIAVSRGQYQAAQVFEAQAADELESIINAQLKMQQQQPDRRQPYRGRGRYQGYFRGAY
jgi:hypothetical protein